MLVRVQPSLNDWTDRLSCSAVARAMPVASPYELLLPYTDLFARDGCWPLTTQKETVRATKILSYAVMSNIVLSYVTLSYVILS